MSRGQTINTNHVPEAGVNKSLQHINNRMATIAQSWAACPYVSTDEVPITPARSTSRSTGSRPSVTSDIAEYLSQSIVVALPDVQ
ncbi:hypothetical protein Pmani_016088 [Petrolisthes manimaculis]|uniref:Uncharacterized protein n=1 Tax=Petrolisthes manimaculis TaxID=1843537 RepID=A0AAE1PPS0_9EUCA|nr:hypothetical protein Pmani_016088 [Petrolisthes manimaculis]